MQIKPIPNSDRAGDDTLSPGNFIYNLTLRYAYTSTSTQYNTHVCVSESHPGCRSVRASSAVDNTQLSAKFHIRKAIVFSELRHFLILSVDTCSYPFGSSQFSKSTGQHKRNSDIRLTSMPREEFEPMIPVIER